MLLMMKTKEIKKTLFYLGEGEKRSEFLSPPSSRCNSLCSRPTWAALSARSVGLSVGAREELKHQQIHLYHSASRGLALGVAMSGAALAQVIAPPLTNALIAQFEWRTAFLVLGLGWGGLALLVCLFFLYDAGGTVGAARNRPKDEGGIAPAPLAGLSKGEALRSSALWRIAIATLLILTVTIAVSVHQFPILVEAGVTRASAAWLASLAGLAGIIGKLLTGHLLDRFHARWIGGITLASTAIAYPLLMNGAGAASLISIGVIISGYAAGTKIQLCTYLTARYAGLKNYGAIFGVMSSMIGLAAAAGPLLAGYSHDRFGSYIGFLWFGVAASMISAALIVSLGRYPDWQKSSLA
jgi:predicted MFS family arabinose efflux permease